MTTNFFCIVTTLHFVFVIVAFADDPKTIPIVSFESSADPDGSYHYSYESGDGSKAQQDGELRVIDKDTSAEVVQGGFEYRDPDDGNVYKLNYIADENGYQPAADHLPVPPPVPDLIQKALAYLATAPPPKDEK